MGGRVGIVFGICMILEWVGGQVDGLVGWHAAGVDGGA